MERIEQKIVFNYLIESQRKVINNTERSIVLKSIWMLIIYLLENFQNR